jgi:hypothetical protein
MLPVQVYNNVWGNAECHIPVCVCVCVCVCAHTCTSPDFGVSLFIGSQTYDVKNNVGNINLDTSNFMSSKQRL